MKSSDLRDYVQTKERAKPPKRKRGRPRKKKVSDDEDFIISDAEESDEEEEEEEAVIESKKIESLLGNTSECGYPIDIETNLAHLSFRRLSSGGADDILLP